jgi:hypothetical protein
MKKSISHLNQGLQVKSTWNILFFLLLFNYSKIVLSYENKNIVKQRTIDL